MTRCLQPDPAARFQTTEELAADLDRLDEAGEPIPIKRVVGLRMVGRDRRARCWLLIGTALVLRAQAAHRPAH